MMISSISSFSNLTICFECLHKSILHFNLSLGQAWRQMYLQVLLSWFQWAITYFILTARYQTRTISTYDIYLFFPTQIFFSFYAWWVWKPFIREIWPWSVEVGIIPLGNIPIMLSYCQEKK